MSPDNTVYPLAEPEEVDVAAIEQELEELWRGAAEIVRDRGAVLHAAAFTLVYVLRADVDSGMASDLLAELTRSHPARTILLKLGDEHAPPLQRAWVTAYCHRPAAGAQEVCSEAITLEIGGADDAVVASLLLALRLSGLPLVLIWDPSLPQDHGLLAVMKDRFERLVVSVIPPCGPASKLEAFFKLRDLLGPATVTTDLLESLIRPWRLAIARQFDPNPAAAEAIREIHLRYSGAKIPAEMLLLAAWMSEALNWQQERFALHGSEPVIAFEGGQRLVFHGHQAAERAEAIVLHTADQGVFEVEEPAGDNRLASLLLLELQIWGHDPLRERYLARARHWLKEILFL